MSSLDDDIADSIEHDDLTRVKLLLRGVSVNVNLPLPRPHNPPPLALAACHTKSTAIVELLLRLGAHIDDADDRGWTACHYAAFACKPDVLALLLTRGANFDTKDVNGETPLQIAHENVGLTDFEINWFNDQRQRQTLTRTRHQMSIDFLAHDGRVRRSRFIYNRISLMLIDAGASLAGVRPDRLCVLASTSTLAIQTLLDRGVVISQLRDSEMRSPLHLLATERVLLADFEAIVNMLVNVCGVDVDARNSNGESCIQLATHCDLLRSFINVGADVNSLTNSGLSLLHQVFDHPDYQEERTMMLLAAGADADARNRFGETVCQSYADVMWVLPAFMAAGADLRGVDPLDIADITADEVEAARREIVKTRLDFVRRRALTVCIGLQSLRLDALQMCEILVHACGPVAPLIAFHHWWAIATTVKHFRD